MGGTMQIIKNLSEVETTGDGLAKALGISRRWVYQLVNEGIIPKSENGKFNVADCTRRYCEYLRSGSTETKVDSQKELIQKKTDYEDVRHQIASLRLAKMKNQVHDAADVERVITGMLVTFRTKILAIPAKLSLQLANKDKGYINAVLTNELREALTELSGYDPAMFTAGDGDDDDDSTEND